MPSSAGKGVKIPKEDADSAVHPRISVLVPIYNEQENIPLLCDELFPVLDRLGCTFEVIAVDDGSRDGSFAVLKAFAEQRPELKVISFRRNYGQTAAIMAAKSDPSPGNSSRPARHECPNRSSRVIAPAMNVNAPLASAIQEGSSNWLPA